jgi:hypothetical protein
MLFQTKQKDLGWHSRWLAEQKMMAHLAQRITFEEAVMATRQAKDVARRPCAVIDCESNS